MKPEAFPAKTAAFVPYVKEDFFVKDKKNTPQVLARRALLVLLDAAIVAFSFYFALLLRADGAVEAAWWPHNRELLYENLPWIVAVYIASFLFSGLYSVLWKYAGERDLMRLAGTVAVPTVVVYCVNRLCIHGVLFNSDGTRLICYPTGKTGNSYVVPDGTLNIETRAFAEAVHLRSVTVANTVAYLGYGVFQKSAVTDVVFAEGGTED